MANNPFDRTIINSRERPISADINQAQSQLDMTWRQFFDQYFGGVSGFTRSSFLVVESSVPAMTVKVIPGFGFMSNPTDVPTAIDGITGLDDRSGYKPVFISAPVTFTVPTAPSGPNTRIDIIEVKRGDRRRENALSRDVLNTSTGIFESDSVNKTLAFGLDGRTGTVTSPTDSTAGLSYKAGVAGNPGVEPSVTSGYVKVAVINVGSAVIQIDNVDIDDSRKIIGPASEERTLILPPSLGQPNTTLPNVAVYAGAVSGIAANWSSLTAGVTRIDLPLPLLAGDRIRAVTVFLDEDNSAAISAIINESNMETAARTDISTKVSGTSGSEAQLSWSDADANFPLTTVVDRAYAITIFLPTTSSNTEAKFFGAKIVYDHP